MNVTSTRGFKSDCGHSLVTYTRVCDECRELAAADAAEQAELSRPPVARDLPIPFALAGYPGWLVPKGGRR